MKLNWETFSPASMLHGNKVQVGAYDVEYVRAYQGAWDVYLSDRVTGEVLSLVAAHNLLGDIFDEYAGARRMPYPVAVRIAHTVARQAIERQGNEQELWEDAWHIAWIGASNPRAVGHTLDKWVNLYGHDNDAVKAIQGHYDFMHGRGLGPDSDILDKLVSWGKTHGYYQPTTV